MVTSKIIEDENIVQITVEPEEDKEYFHVETISGGHIILNENGQAFNGFTNEWYEINEDQIPISKKELITQKSLYSLSRGISTWVILKQDDKFGPILKSNVGKLPINEEILYNGKVLVLQTREDILEFHCLNSNILYGFACGYNYAKNN